MPRCTRRELIAGTARLAGAGAAAGAGATLLAPVSAGAAVKPPPSDPELMATLLGVEQLVVFVYERALAAGTIDARARALAGEVIAHERAHVAALAQAVPGLEALAPPPPATVRAANAALAKHHVTVDLAHQRSSKGWVKLLVDVEDVLERNYHLAISLLRRAALLRLCAQIMGSEAQHSALLAELLYPHDVKKALADAFVNGG